MGNGRVDAAADRLREPQPVARIRLGRRRVVLLAGGRVREQLLPALDVVRKPAARQHDAVPGAHEDGLALVLDQRTCDAVVLRHQLLHRRRQPDRDVAVHRRLRQAAGERVAVGERHAPAMHDDVEKVPAQPLGHVDERGERLEGAHEVADLRPGAEHHSEYGELGQRRGELLDALAQLAAIERARDHGAAALLSAGCLRVIVGEHRGHVELHAGVAGEEVDRLRPVLEESIDALLVEVGGGLVLEVGLRRARRLLDALLGGEPCPGDPQPAAGARGSAPVAGLLLDHQYLEAVVGRRHRSRHP